MQQFFLVDISQKPATENTMYLGNDILELCLLAAFPRDLQVAHCKSRIPLNPWIL